MEFNRVKYATSELIVCNTFNSVGFKAIPGTDMLLLRLFWMVLLDSHATLYIQAQLNT